MLSPLGSLILLEHRSGDYEAALSSVGPDMPLDKAEQDKFGINHTLIGAYLLSLWGFSHMLVEAVAYASWPSSYSCPRNPILPFVHAARAFGPRFPLLPDGFGPPHGLDMNYLAEIRHDKYVNRWKRLAQSKAND